MSEAHQLSILPERHEIAIAPVPSRLALVPERVWIVMRRRTELDLTEWHIPAQWSPHEAAILIHEIKGVVWHAVSPAEASTGEPAQLDGSGGPRDYAECRRGMHPPPNLLEEIKAICEQFCKGKYL